MTQNNNRLTLAWIIFTVALATFAAVTKWHHSLCKDKGIRYQCRILIDETQFEKHEKKKPKSLLSLVSNPSVSHDIPKAEASGRAADDPFNIEKFYESSKYGSIPKLSPDGLRVLDVCSVKKEFPAGQKIVHLVVRVNNAPLDSLFKILEILKDLKITFVIPHYHDNLHDVINIIRKKGHEFLLQIPTQSSIPDNKKSTVSPFLANSEKDELLAKLLCLLASTKYAIGIANTSSTLLTKSTKDMSIICEEISRRGLVFLDLANSGEVVEKMCENSEVISTNTDTVFSGDVSSVPLNAAALNLKEGKIFFVHIDALKGFLAEFLKQNEYVVAPVSRILKR